jgi:FxsC-like protein
MSGNGHPAYPYFFLSYAHSAPLAGFQPETTDYWVRQIFADLSDAVRRAARLGRGSRVGFFDGLLEAGADWNGRTAEMLSKAQVFVPLYSTQYFAMSWPGREWACFTERLVRTGAGVRDEPSTHIVPVLWAPLAQTRVPSNAPDALSFIDDVPEYAENGLRALKMLNLYGEQYERVVERLGEQIAEAAHRRPLRTFQVPRLDDVASAFRVKGTDDDFVVAVAAPTRETVPDGRTASWYEHDSTGWRPFGAQEQLHLGYHAESVAERLNFTTAVLGAGAASGEVADKPAVVLIDPWIAAPVNGREGAALNHVRELYAGRGQRRWVLPVLVLNTEDPESQARKSELISEVTRILNDVGAPPADPSQGGSDVITSMDDFARLMPALVAEAERRYLRDYLSGEARFGIGGGSTPLEDEERERPDG